MKILYALNSSKPGGMEQHVLDLVVGMVGEGNSVFVWCDEGPIVGWYKKAGAQVTVRKIRFDIDPIYILALVRFLKENKVDIVHSHELKACTNASLAGFLAGTKVKLTHNHTPMSEWQIPWYKKLINSLKFFGYAVLVQLFVTREIALTQSRKLVKMKEGINENKLVVLPNGVDTKKLILTETEKQNYRAKLLKELSFDADTFVFGCVGRFTQEKDHKTLIKAFFELLKYSSVSKGKVGLVLAGGGILELQLVGLIKELGLEDKVKITGVFQDSKKIEYYSSFDVFVFPSLAEGFGIVLVEAMVFGIPTICSDLEVLQEVGGATVMYFQAGDPKDLAQKMADLYLRRDYLEELKKAEIDRVETLFGMPKFVANYSSLYAKLLGEDK